MPEPQVPGGDTPEGDVPDTDEAAREPASQQDTPDDTATGGQAQDGSSQAAGNESDGANETAEADNDPSGAIFADVVWPTEDESVVQVESGVPGGSSGAFAGSLRFPERDDADSATDRADSDGPADGADVAEASSAGTDATAEAAAQDAEAGSGVAARDVDAVTEPVCRSEIAEPSGETPTDEPVETPVERTQNIEPVVEPVGDTEETQRIEVVPPAERTDPGQNLPAEDTERTQRMNPIVAAPHDAAPGSNPSLARSTQPGLSRPATPPDADARPTERIPRAEVGDPAGTELGGTARPEHFGFASAPEWRDAEAAAPASPGPEMYRSEPYPAGPDRLDQRDAPITSGAEQWADQGTAGQGARAPSGAVRAADAGQHGTEPVPGSGGMGRSRRMWRRAALVATAFAAVVVVGVGALFLPGLFGGPATPPPDPVQLSPAVRPVDGAQAPKPTRNGVESELRAQLNDPVLGKFVGTVVDARSGETVWDRDSDRTMVPASTEKLLTTSAALLTLDHDKRFTTKVVQGTEPGSVVLVGGGDPTLSKLPSGQDSFYGDTAHLDELTDQVRRATGGDVRSVQVDTSRYSGPSTEPGWQDSDISEGYVAPVDPVMLDGARADPNSDTSPRSHQPALQAAQELGAGLGVREADVSEGNAPNSGRVLGEVKSPPVRELVEHTLQHSDNVMAEGLAREVAVSTGHPPTFDGATKAVRDVLTQHGIDVSGTKNFDGSGMSPENRLAPDTLGNVMRAATRPATTGSVPPTTAKLRDLLPGLPVAGGSGSLADRYEGSDGRGWVRAKTGTLDGVNSLSGTVLTRDGRVLAFALMSNGSNAAEARPALDEVAAGLRECGCR